jgi:MFS transporter, FHS family, L-fucose permease
VLNPPISPSTQRSDKVHHKLFSRETVIPFILVTALFFLWGIPNNLNDVLIRQFMKSFELSRLQAGLVQSAFYLGYFLLSMPAAFLMRSAGYKSGLVTGLLLYSAGAFLFWPAAANQSYPFFLFALFVIASGLAFLETGASPFIAQIGDPDTAERRLNFSQAFNPLGSICGVVIGTIFIFSNTTLSPAKIASLKAAGQYQAVLRSETMRVIAPYLVLGVVVLVWAILIIRTPFPRVGEEASAGGERDHGSLRNLFRYPHFLFAVLAQFFYVGAQVGTWSYFISYVEDYAHQSDKVAGYFLTGTLVAFAVGRFAATWLMQFITPSRLMGLYAIANFTLVLLGIALPGWIGIWAIFLTSLFMSLMFPTIFGLGLRGLGANTKLGGSLLVMAIIGGAVFTPLMGLIAESTRSMAEAMLVPLTCYLVVTAFAFLGPRAIGEMERTAPIPERQHG